MELELHVPDVGERHFVFLGEQGRIHTRRLGRYWVIASTPDGARSELIATGDDLQDLCAEFDLDPADLIVPRQSTMQ